MKRFFEKYNIISFDIFDTLILRNVSTPHRIFEIIEKNCNFSNSINNFSDVRIQCEINAYKRFGIPTLDEIYQIMCELYPTEIVQRYKKEEIKWELLLCTGNPSMKKIYKDCIKRGKRIILISDMYLPRHIIEKMLSKCGIYNYEKLFISSEVKFSKRDCKIFEYVLEDLSVSPNDIFHIGDNIRNDYFNPKLKHIHSHLLLKVKKKKNYKNYEEEILDNFLENKSINKNFRDIGYSSFGPLLYGYINWLHEILKKESIEYILFFSRDGYFIQKAYNFLFDIEAVPNAYFYASRRLFLVAVLWMTPELNDVLQIMYLPKYFTLNQFIDSIGLNKRIIQDEIEKSDICLQQEYNKESLLNSKRFIEFYSSIKNKIIEKSKCEYEALIIRLKELNMEHKNLAIVDIGWIGNMQKCFEMIIQKTGLSINVKGYYLGVDPKSQNQKKHKMRGYLYQEKKNEKLYSKGRFIECIYELFFMAPHGSALYYELKNYEVKPVCKEFEYKGTQTLENFLEIQKGAFEFINDFAEIGATLSNNELIYSQYILKTFLCPTLDFARTFGEMEVYADRWCNLAKPKNSIEMILKPSQRYRDFMLSIWKPGYLKRLFRIPLPYDKLLGKMFELMNCFSA